MKLQNSKYSQVTPGTGDKNSGFALVLVLIIVAILATLVTEMNFSSSINARVTANLRDSEKAFYLAKSGVSMGTQRIRMDTLAHQIFSQFIGNSDNQSEFWWTVPLMYPLGAEMFKDALKDAGMDSKGLDAFAKSQDIGGSFISEISDESSRINLNDIQLAGTTPNGAYLVLLNLLTLPKFNKFFKDKNRDELVNYIVDWIDVNSDKAGLGGGIEDTDYPDYHVKSNSFFSPSELKLVNDVNWELYKTLEPFITVFPYTVPQSPTPLGKINLNTAPREIIASLFDKAVVSDPWLLSKEIVKARDNGTIFGSKAEFTKLVNDQTGANPDSEQKAIPRAIDNILDTRTDYFRIKSTGVVGDTTKTITVVIDRKNRQYITLYWRAE